MVCNGKRKSPNKAILVPFISLVCVESYRFNKLVSLNLNLSRGTRHSPYIMRNEVKKI